MKEIVLQLLLQVGQWVITDGMLEAAAAAVGLFVLKKWHSAKAAQFLETATRHAYNIVNDEALRSPNKIDDKAALFVQKLNLYFKANLNRPATPAEIEKAELLAKSLHGEEKVAEKIGVEIVP